MGRFASRDDRFVGVPAQNRPSCAAIGGNCTNGARSHILECCLRQWIGVALAAPDAVTIGETFCEAQEWQGYGYIVAGIDWRLLSAPHDDRSRAYIEPGCTHDIVERETIMSKLTS